MAWTTLFILVGMMVTLTVAGYLGEGNSLKNSLEEAEMKVHQHAVHVAELESAEGNFKMPKLTLADSIIRQASKIVLDAKQPAASSPKPSDQERARMQLESAKLSVAADYEAGKAIPADELQAIGALGDPNFAKIYRAKKLAPQDAKLLIAQLPNEPSVEVLAKIHALKKSGVKNPYLAVIGHQTLQISLIVGAIVVLLIGAGVTLWIAFFAFRMNGWAIPLGHPAMPMTMASSERFALRAVQLLVLFIGIQVLAGALYAKQLITEDVAELIATAGIVLMLIGLSRVAIDGKRISLASIGWNRERLGANILWGLGGAVANAPLLLFLAFVSDLIFGWLPTHPHPVQVELGSAHRFLTVLLISISASVGAPIFEESLFRGILLPAISTRFRSAVVGILLSSFMFAALHPTGPPEWLPLAGIGAVSACLSYQTRSIVPSVVMHAAHNLAALLIALAWN